MNVMTDPRREFATRVKPDPIDPRGRAYKVVDTDFHLLPEWSDLRKYMKEPFRSELTSFPLAGGDYSPKYAIGLEGTGQETQGRARTAADILRVIDEIAVDTVILTPGFTRPQSMFHQAMVTATAAAYNDFLIHEVFPASPRIKAEIMINHRNPADGAAEIRRVGAHPGFVGVYTEFGGNYEPIGTARHDPIFEAAVEHDLVVTSHIGMFWQKATPLVGGHANLDRAGRHFRRVHQHGLCRQHDHAGAVRQISDAARWSSRKAASGGCRNSWRAPTTTISAIPATSGWSSASSKSGEKFLAKLPSEYFESNIRFSSQPMCFPKNPEHFKLLMTLCKGEDWLLYSSDWPHATFDPLNWVFNSVISEAGRRKILSENARGWIKRLA